MNILHSHYTKMIPAETLYRTLEEILLTTPLLDQGNGALARLIRSPAQERLYCLQGTDYAHSHGHSAAAVVLEYVANGCDGVYCILQTLGKVCVLPDFSRVFVEGRCWALAGGQVEINGVAVEAGVVTPVPSAGVVAVYDRSARHRVILVCGTCRKKNRRLNPSPAI